ncbi:MAG: NAD-dependent epimerase/dehydratase family protein [Bacteroidales bacterium]|mgnify:FL=1|nr:NAD-dependent epimerase/dehydratase family protein [Bacteroidales bacterium]HOA09090.1 NAD-dependent epimerase/dehydratase family protein [Tenuifilaceae bacterium]MBP8644157.1 NAD-dependent epimerase/dehydratase family protein [Bacteroidales bacterium]NLI88701.1 NAD-dependent epimerase/dehydratase family protein [Bacteroidales bacterium]HOC35943.1 NAD-dependent epimerase/dehydratase family protein [Tenuifilaceae bacterium]
MKNILVVGAGGQIGSELVPYLRKIYGNEHVVAADINSSACTHLAEEGPFEELDALKADRYLEIVKKYRIDTIFNLVALLSATGEKKPQLAWHVNMGALMNSLEIARENSCAVFTPSSIGAFGPTSPLDNTPQDTVMRPTTIYGICKVTGELLSDYYFLKYGVDTRSVRFPGIISNVTLPGGGTTDYAVEIFYGAVQHKHYVCPLPEGTYLDMMYMPDALDACVQLMEADPSKLKHRNSFNVTAMSFEPSQVYSAIRRRIPDFTMEYSVDPVKKAIADSWPNYMDDSCARQEWGWSPKWNLETMTDDMLRAIGEKMKKGLLG